MDLFSNLSIEQIQENVKTAKRLDHAHTIQDAIEKASYVGKTEITIYDWTDEELYKLGDLGFQLSVGTDTLRISWEGDE
ncbi:hypothetical protein [Lactobacillus acetotolerans]|uniref:hypothetical protein n=1 Tax=Lactobacillus acetotolerans TaxID=1600 RepID=UPI002FD99990